MRKESVGHQELQTDFCVRGFKESKWLTCELDIPQGRDTAVSFSVHCVIYHSFWSSVTLFIPNPTPLVFAYSWCRMLYIDLRETETG